MSNLTPKQQQLMGAWGAIHKGAGEALEWVDQVRGNAASVEAEADGLNLRLHRARNLANNLQQAAQTPMVIGFFGLSQAGKSYLISALSADSNGSLKTELAGKTFEFLHHVNPSGMGKEATGVVTRFSRWAQPSPDDNYPVELKLFSEIEVAKILANSWFEDFDQDRLDYEFTEERIQSALKEFEGRETENLQPGVTADDVVALWDYLNSNYEKAVRKLGDTYWPRVMKLAPRLNYRQRAKLFSILWGEQHLLTEVYEQLVGALQKMGHPQTVYAPLSALVHEQSPGVYIQVNNIMNVDTLGRLNTGRDIAIDVRPVRDGKVQASTGITIAQLAILTVEMTFRLTNEAEDPVLKDADLLDFPGYRSRYRLLKIEEAAECGIDETNPVASLILRGKVAYLFERYSDTQQMNALVFCTNTKGQSEVVTVGSVLTRWIHNTQGATPKEREQRAPGLIWAITMLDIFVNGALDSTKESLPEVWQNMVKMTLSERFGNLEWMKDWSGQPFNNTYLVRKPRRSDAAFIDMDNGSERGYASQHVQRLGELKEAFASNLAIQRHVNAPEEAFEAMLGLNDGGITRFSSSFKSVSNIEFKLSRIEQQLQQCRTDLLEHGLHVWREEDFEQLLNKKLQKTQYLLDNLGEDPDVIGDLIHALQLPVEQLRELYLGGVYDINGLDAEAEAEPEQNLRAPANKAPALKFNNMFVGDKAAPVAASKKPLAQRLTPDQRFARAALKAWIKHMRDVGTRPLLLNSLRVNKELVDALTEELISAVRSKSFMAELDLAVSRREHGGIHRDQLVQRQVLSVQLVMRDFLSWFGLLAKPEAERPPSLLGESAPVFSFYRSVPAGELPQLPEEPTHKDQRYQVDWFSGLAWLTQENAKSGADPEITTEQRRQLAVLLNTFEAS